MRVCVVTGSRADYSLLLQPMRTIAAHPGLTLQVAVTGMHLSERHDHTGGVVQADGFDVDARVPSLQPGDDAVSVTRSLGQGVTGFAEAFARLDPELLVVLGDRYEILAAVQAALVARIPVAHLCGGDVTEGAFDESIRHAITKMSHVHLVSNADSGRRVRQMGEDPAHIHVVGSPGIDQLEAADPLGRDELFEAIGLAPRPHNLSVTYQPVTLDPRDGRELLGQLLAALDALGPDVGLVFTGANADPGGGGLDDAVRQFADTRPHAVYRTSLGPTLYPNLLRHVDAVVGNSSSGLYEAPSFGIPTVNIGDRQKGRLRAQSVIDVADDAQAITAAIRRALAMDASGVTNPYGDGRASGRIVDVIAALADAGPATLLQKRFHDLADA